MMELGTRFAPLGNIPKLFICLFFYLFNKYTQDPKLDAEDTTVEVIGMVPNIIVWASDQEIYYFIDILHK